MDRSLRLIVPTAALCLLLAACGEAQESPSQRGDKASAQTEAPAAQADGPAQAAAPAAPADPPPSKAEPATPEPAFPEPLVEPVLTQEQRDALSPTEIIDSLQQGNQRFVAGTLTVRDHSEQVRVAVKGQFPKAAILSCIDSRVPVEDVFDRGIGDLFVARVAGNFENQDILGSMEFATKVAGAKILLVLGHEECGAIKGAIDKVELGNLTAMLANITPAIELARDFAGDKTSANSEYVNYVGEKNVIQTIADIRERSEVLRELERSGDLQIVGALYDMDTGSVRFLEPS